MGIKVEWFVIGLGTGYLIAVLSFIMDPYFGVGKEINDKIEVCQTESGKTCEYVITARVKEVE